MLDGDKYYGVKIKHYLVNEQVGLKFNIEWSGKASLRKCHLIKNL